MKCKNICLPYLSEFEFRYGGREGGREGEGVVETKETMEKVMEGFGFAQILPAKRSKVLFQAFYKANWIK